MKKTTKRLREEELVNEMQPVAPAQPATPAEVAEAAPTAEVPIEEPAVPAPTEEEPIISTPQAATVPSDPLTPPAPGMIPSGWIRPEDLAAAIAQQTGDMEVASTADDAVVTEEPVPEESVVGAEPTVEQPAQPAEDDVILESISKEELEVIKEYRRYKTLYSKISAEELGVIREYRKYKALHEESEGGLESQNNLDALSVSDSSEEAIEEMENLFTNLHEASEEDDIDVEDILDSEEDEVVEDDDMLGIEALSDNMYSVMEDDFEADDNIMMKVEDLLASFEDVGSSEDVPEVLRSVADFFDGVVEDKEVEEEEEVEEDESDFDEEDFEVEDGDEEEDLEEVLEDEEDDFEELPRRVECKVSRREKLSEDIIYPAGSSPLNNFPSADSNLVKSYAESQARRREAIKNYRESIKSARTSSNDRFAEALNSKVNLKESSTPSNPNSWSSNRFFDKYKESKEFSFNDLLKNGFLG